MPLDSLPLELLTLICLKLDRKSLITMPFVNHMFYNLFSEHKTLKYYFELARAGMDDGPSNHIFTVTSRMDRLKRYQMGWSKLDLTSPRKIEPFSGDKIGEEIHMNGDLLGEATTYPLGHDPEIRSLVQFWELSNFTRPDDGPRSLGWFFLEHAISSYAIDPSQALLVVQEESTSLATGRGNAIVKTYLYELSADETITPHPRANIPVLEKTIQSGSCHCAVSICRDYVGALFTITPIVGEDSVSDGASANAGDDIRSHVVIWNWKTGQCIFDLTDIAMAFSFLSDQHILLAVPTNTQGGAQTVALTLVNFQLASTPSSCHVVASLLLPDLLSGKQINGVELFTSPVQAHVRAEDDRSSAVPFQLSWDNRLFVLSLDCDIEVTRNGFAPILFIPMSTLLPHLHSTPQHTDMSLPDRCVTSGVPWMYWGPCGSRMFVLKDDEMTSNCVYGSRFVSLVYEQEDEEDADADGRLPRVGVLDFNTLSLSSGLSLASEDAAMDLDTMSTTEIVSRTQPTTISMEDLGLFASDVVTYLPFRRTLTSKELELKIDYVMQSQGHIVTADHSGDFLEYYAVGISA
ncbi:hypothetical protein BD410DRAFT_52210 [Rickenella mellea]|uniref:F-box domain-containing protein n=1 Tax=Rickenella mellea TaxID=50990 RepID=A0A4R5XH18_9AGAM|nr:hypothetical protein BD410DRAFT_52210 [Rickenella mellea]